MKKVKNLLLNIAKKSKTFRKILRFSNTKLKKIRYFYYYKRYKVNDKVILFDSYNGKSYACNPKAIYEQMLKMEEFKDYTFIWAFVDPKSKEHFFKDTRTRLIKYNSKQYLKYCSIAKYWITNSLIDISIKKKENQIYIQTWHGTPLKKLRCDIEVDGSVLNSREEIVKRNNYDAVRFDYFLSPSPFATNCFTSAFNLRKLNKTNIIVEKGYPRNDYLFNYTNSDVKRIKKELKIPANKKVLLYAPTFRDNEHQTGLGYTYSLNLDFDNLKKSLGKDYIILFRTHYFVANSFDFDKYKGFVYDVSNYDDINELYVISDILITDYSSVFFDYANLDRPIIFYMYDLELYKNKLRDFYFELDELPGPIVKDENTLIKEIKNVSKNVKKYQEKYLDFQAKFNPLDNGYCSKKVIKDIFERHSENKVVNNKNNTYILILFIIAIIISFLIGYFCPHDKINKVFKANTKIEDCTFSRKEKNLLKGVALKKNSTTRLNIKSSYGDIEAYHPKILYFKNKWHGYHYWMVYTPYPDGKDYFENPHIMVSNDMINFKEPAKGVNPLDEPEGRVPMRKYNSDSHLVYNDDLDQLEVYWRLVDDTLNRVIMYKMISRDGINWVDKQEYLVSEDRKNFDFLSPAIIYEDGIHKMWYVNKNNTLTYVEMKDDEEIDKQVIELEYPENVKIWHLDMIKTEKGYEMIFVAYKNWSAYHFMDLYYAKSEDGIHFEPAKPIMRSSEDINDWDGQGLYRSTFIYKDGMYYVWYCGRNRKYKGMAIAFGKDITNLKATNIDFIKDEKAALKFKTVVKKEICKSKEKK